ncbi:hypothetical protein ACQY0O_007819 [Thecaphora frezii]
MWTSFASVSVLFLVLYLLVFSCLVFLYLTKSIKVRSRWTLVFFHVTVRLVSQVIGIVFGVQGFKDVNILVAYFILAAEGYFTLVLSTARFLVSWHNHHFGDSWLERRRDKTVRRPVLRQLADAFSLSQSTLRQRPMNTVEWLLISANALIIAGGSLRSAATFQTDESEQFRQNQRDTARTLASIGQCVFFVVNVALFVCIAVTIRQYRRRNPEAPVYGHPTLGLLCLTWPFLATRGVFGVLQSAIPELSYFDVDNYTENGFTNKFVAEEACLTITPEWVSCAMLVATYFTSRNDPPKPPLPNRAEAGQLEAQNDEKEPRIPL